MSLRRCPLDPLPPGETAWHGLCKWCLEPIVHPPGHKRAGERIPNRTWHSRCAEAYKLHAFPDVQRRHVLQRDGRRCWVCKAEPSKWSRGPVTRRGYWDEDEPAATIYVGPYCPTDLVTSLELDHTVPLWSVQTLELALRRPFYGPTNLRLLCPSHHAEKTAREAAERASMKRRPSLYAMEFV